MVWADTNQLSKVHLPKGDNIQGWLNFYLPFKIYKNVCPCYIHSTCKIIIPHIFSNTKEDIFLSCRDIPSRAWNVHRKKMRASFLGFIIKTPSSKMSHIWGPSPHYTRILSRYKTFHQVLRSPHSLSETVPCAYYQKQKHKVLKLYANLSTQLTPLSIRWRKPWRKKNHHKRDQQIYNNWRRD